MHEVSEISQKTIYSRPIFVGEGEMGQRFYETDWSKTKLGPFERWPDSLKSALSMTFNCQFPMAIYWGQEGYLFYNDAWRPIVGDKHPWALGKPGKEVWSEIWHLVGPVFNEVFKNKKGKFQPNSMLPMKRFGYVEECYFDYNFSPIIGSQGIVEGVLNVVTETTYQVLNERRTKLLQNIAAQITFGKSVDVTCQLILKAISSNPYDVPFAILYLVNNHEKQACLSGMTGIEKHSRITPEVIDLASPSTSGQWPLFHAIQENRFLQVENIGSHFTYSPSSVWDEPCQTAIIIPMENKKEAYPCSFLIVGVNPRRALDTTYQTFHNFLANAVENAISHARAYEAEKKRIDALAEIDKAKTVFFSNVSHEFRTPLTLMLGPLEDSLSDKKAPLFPKQLERQILIQRNALRLLKLVNSLLDFSRIEANRIQAIYEPTDLSRLTADLASMFSSTLEKAQIKFTVEVHPIDEPVYVDKEMWEKIIFNLLSNAFKFTFKGEIKIILRKSDNKVVLIVEDTGVGIPAKELPRLFERFHRIESTKGRSYEGTGIGLALTQELVRQHGGLVNVESVEEEGTKFIIHIPLGHAHLPQQALGHKRESYTPKLIGTAYVEEAARWLPQNQIDKKNQNLFNFGNTTTALQKSDKSIRLLLADDNADMRQYVSSILSEYWQVEMVENGEEALKAILATHPKSTLSLNNEEISTNKPFDLVLSDVMMPKLNGFELIEKLRNNIITKHLPVILLSARAGDEARVEGLNAGANDYLVKPFSAKELIARINTQLELAKLRNQLEEMVSQRTQELEHAMNVLRLEMSERIRTEKELAEQKTSAKMSQEYRARLEEFINTICHELRNPLNVINGCTTLLQHRVDDIEEICKAELAKSEILSYKKILQILNIAKEELLSLDFCCKQQKEIADDVLNLSKIESNKIELHPVAFKLQQLFNNILKMYIPQMEQKRLNLIPHIPKEDIWLKADSFRLSQVISNLFSNAVKFTKSGSITITVEVKDISVTESVLNIRFDDTGIGMTQEEVSRLFQQFGQANSRIASNYGGSGLGLIISKKLVEKMGGSIKVQSKESKGSTFEFDIKCTKLSENEIMQLKAEQINISPKLLKHNNELIASELVSGKVILIVEDNIMNMKILIKLLELRGYRYDTAENGLAAIEKCKKYLFDLIIMDIEMPVMNGIEATKQLRANSISTPIIALSGNAREDQINAAFGIGFTDYLTKPVHQNDLYEMIDQYINMCANETLKLNEKQYKARISAHANLSLFNQISPEKANIEKTNATYTYLTGIFNQSTQYMIAIDNNYVVTVINHACKREAFKIFGKEINVGTNVIEAFKHMPEKQTRVLAMWNDALLGKKCTSYEKFVDTEGIEHTYKIETGPIKGESGEIIGAFHSGKTISLGIEFHSKEEVNPRHPEEHVSKNVGLNKSY